MSDSDVDRMLTDPASWARGDARDPEWIVDCYRLRAADESGSGGIFGRGLYSFDANADDIVTDFFFFTKLCVARGALPPRFDWAAYFRFAGELLVYDFDGDCASEKWPGQKNIFAPVTGSRSLRHTGALIYGTSYAYAQFVTEDEIDPVRRHVVNELNAAVLASGRGPETAEELFACDAAHFEDVGGVEAWRTLRGRVNAELVQKVQKMIESHNQGGWW